MKHLATFFIILSSFSLFYQEITNSKPNSYQFYAGIKSRNLFKNAIYYKDGAFGSFSQNVGPDINFLFSTSVYIIPNSLNFEIELPFSIFSNDPSKVVKGGSSVGLTYYFLEHTKLGLHPSLGTSIKIYKIDHFNTFVIPLSFGLTFEKKWFSIDFSYNQVFQKYFNENKFYDNFVDLGFKINFGKLDELKTDNKFHKIPLELSCGIGIAQKSSYLEKYGNISIGYHFNSKYSGTLNYQYYNVNSDESFHNKYVILLDLDRKWKTKGYVTPYLGASVGYGSKSKDNYFVNYAGLIYGLNAGVQIKTNIDPNLTLKSNIRLLSSIDKYKKYEMNVFDFNILQLSYLF